MYGNTSVRMFPMVAGEFDDSVMDKSLIENWYYVIIRKAIQLLFQHFLEALEMVL